MNITQFTVTSALLVDEANPSVTEELLTDDLMPYSIRAVPSAAGSSFEGAARIEWTMEHEDSNSTLTPQATTEAPLQRGGRYPVIANGSSDLAVALTFETVQTPG